MVWAVIGLLGALVTGAFALYSQIGDLKTDVAVVKTTAATINERVTRIDKSVESVLASGVTASSALSRIEARLSAMSLQQQPNLACLNLYPLEALRLCMRSRSLMVKSNLYENLSNRFAWRSYQCIKSAKLLQDIFVHAAGAYCRKNSKTDRTSNTVDRGGTILIVDGATYRIAAIIPPI